MFNQKTFKYGNLNVLELEIQSCDDIINIQEKDFDIVKLLINPENCNVLDMEKNGYIHADRTIGSSIPLFRQTQLEKFIRLPIIETNDYKEELFQIASKSFPYDRRFHLKKQYNADLANDLIRNWIDELDKTLVCLYKDLPIGFLSIKNTGEKTNFVHLAAVDEKYRNTGAAMSLYSKAILISKENNKSELAGRISSRNMPVMNLYSFFGAKFSDPIDIYIKEVS